MTPIYKKRIIKNTKEKKKEVASCGDRTPDP